ncbi:MAG: alpha/beta hydrolase, partial [Candidatus Paceibacterota bacterium]
KFALKEIFDNDRRTITVNHPRVGGQAPMDFRHARLSPDFPKNEVRKALTILDVLKAEGVEKTDMIMHSESAINGIIAATLEPERFRNLVLFAPSGLIGKDTFPRLLQGFFEQGKGRAESMKEFPVTEKEKWAAETALRESVKYALKNPLRATMEAMDISETQIDEMLQALREQGIGIVVMATVDDPVFPMELVQKAVDTKKVDGFISLKGGHGAIGEHPERYVALALKMLDALKAKAEK